MTKKKKQPSPALHLVLHVWNSACKATPHSWERLNHTMYDSVKLAITGGLTFDVDDFAVISKECRSGYWLYIEQAYGMAVGTPNPSAYQAIERHLDREPIIADNVNGQAWGHYDTSRHSRGRLAEGCRFNYQGLRPKVTSFNNGYVVACTYKPQKDGEYANKVARQFKLTKEDIIIDRADQKERIWIAEKGRKVWGEKAYRQFLRSFAGDRTMLGGFLQLPRKQIDAALKKLGLLVGKAAEKAGRKP